jgi:tetratricopeptide (TPR) repeat protein
MPLDPEALLRRLEAAGFAEEASDLRTSGTLGHTDSGEAALDESVPDRLGPFEIVGELGQGGYGAVLLGTQHRPVRRLAAVKLLKRGMDSQSVLARFRAEQQALAMMDHRAVATVLETGVAEDGRPWFAMPLVAGVPITVHADLERLGVEARLRLFREAALGVMHAHERGVLHRDLKPSNILVGVERGAAQPRVIDFGIAKAIDATNPLVTNVTMGEAVLGTPAYMAPEQALGRAEVRSDVWALGVILGELLAGVRPLNREPSRGTDGRLEVAACVRPAERFQRWLRLDAREATEAASARGCTPEALTAALQGDLDAIVGHCLQEEPSRRYPTVSALIEDIDRHLSGRPVIARPASAAYLAARFARRHRWGVAAVAIVAMALVTATFVSVRAAIIARGEARASRAVTDFLVQMLGAADPWRPGGQQEVRVRDALDAAALRLTKGEFAGRARETARIELAIGAARLQLGLAQEARPALERAVALFRSADASEQSGLAEALHRLGLCLQALGELPAAEAALRESVAIHEVVDGPSTTLCLQARNDLALCLQERGDVESAERIYREVLQALGVSSEDRPEVRAGTLGNLGMLLQGTGRLQEAKEPIRQALETNLQRLGSDDLELAMDWNNLGLLQKDLGERTDAEKSLRESLRILRRGLDAGHPNIALVEINLADLLQRMDRGPEAMELLTQAAATARTAYGPDHSEVARAHNMLGFALRDAGRVAASEAAFREAVRVWKISPGGDHPDLATGLNNLARAAQDGGRPQEALTLAEEAVAMIGKVSGEDDPRRWVFLARRGSILVDLKRWSDADAQLQAALEGLERCEAPVSRRRTVLEALVTCHEGWSLSAPSTERSEAAAGWRKRLDALESAES